jgi:hypothetical protein
MPSPFVAVIVKSNNTTANRIVNTCFTFAAQKTNASQPKQTWEKNSNI